MGLGPGVYRQMVHNQRLVQTGMDLTLVDDRVPKSLLNTHNSQVLREVRVLQIGLHRRTADYTTEEDFQVGGRVYRRKINRVRRLDVAELDDNIVTTCSASGRNTVWSCA